MKKNIAWVELKRYGIFRFSEIVDPEYLETADKDCSDVTGFVAVTIEKELNLSEEKRKTLYSIYGASLINFLFSEEKVVSHYYFIGKVLDFSEVSHMIRPEFRSDYVDTKFAVSFDENGEIFDILPYTDNMHPVENFDELSKAYFESTGYLLPVSSKKNTDNNTYIKKKKQ